MTLLIKVCGLRTVDATNQAVESGADLLGVIMVPGRKRTVSPEVALKIAELARQKRELLNRRFQTAHEIVEHMKSLTFKTHSDYFQKFQTLVVENGPFLVGVFQNQNIDDVFAAAREYHIDFVQLHGSEDIEEYLARDNALEYAFIKRYVIPHHIESMKNFFPKVIHPLKRGFAFPLLDSELGGEGQTIDWTLINDLDGDFVLAGGLAAENLLESKPYLKNVFGFDVSSGVEDENGNKDLEKIDRFVAIGKQVLAESAQNI